MIFFNTDHQEFGYLFTQVDPTNNDVMNDVLSKEKSMDSLNIHIKIRKKE